MDLVDIQKFTKSTKASWNSSAHLHCKGKSWEELLRKASEPNFQVLDDCLTKTILDLNIEGKRAVQIGCNNARELLSLASFGAEPALGLDISSEFLAQGAKLAEIAGLNPRLVEADIYNLPDDLGQYDFALITIGVINWMPYLKGFFQALRRLLKPEAKLVIYETHPILEMFNPWGLNPHTPEISYFDKQPQKVEDAITYDGTDGGKGDTGYWFVYTLGDIVTACVESDFSIVRLTEHPHSNRETDYDIYENRDAQLPMCYTLIATAI